MLASTSSRSFFKYRIGNVGLRSFSNSFNFSIKKKDQFSPVVKISKTGIDLLNDPILNKGVGFTASERDRFGVRGLVPFKFSSLEEQEVRVMERLSRISNNLDKYLNLTSLQDRNETLFYRILTKHIKQLAPIVYTPTVGRVCQQYGYLYRRPRGMYLSPYDKGEISSIVWNFPQEQVDVAVITDGSRILGLGDLGANGMPIPIGKLSLYVAAAGINPARILPILLDVGTNNESFLNDPLYMGLQERRVSSEILHSLIEETLFALREKWPNILVQFEDFNSDNAYPILTRNRKKYLCFNDDIQGTGAVALGGIYAALKVQGNKPSDLKHQRIVCLGGGSAGIGVSMSLLHGMSAQGISPEEAQRHFWLVDKDGLITTARRSHALGQERFARSDLPEGMPLLEVVKHVKPTILLGLSGVGGLFTKEVVQEMAKHNERPILFPLSNPTDRAECTAQNAFEWTQGRCIFASGSPFDPVTINGITYYPSQGNNMFIFPGVGLGATVCKAKRVSLTMFARAAEVLSECVPADKLKNGIVYPDISDIQEVSVQVAMEVCTVAFEQDLAQRRIPEGKSLENWIRESMWKPVYYPYVKSNK